MCADGSDSEEYEPLGAVAEARPPGLRGRSQLRTQPSTSARRSVDVPPAIYGTVVRRHAPRPRRHADSVLASASAAPETPTQAAEGTEQDAQRAREANRRKQAAYRTRMRERIKAMQVIVAQKKASRADLRARNASLIAQFKAATDALDSLATETPGDMGHSSAAAPVIIATSPTAASPQRNSQDISWSARLGHLADSSGPSPGAMPAQNNPGHRPCPAGVDAEKSTAQAAHGPHNAPAGHVHPPVRTRLHGAGSTSQPKSLQSYAHFATINQRDIMPHLSHFRNRTKGTQQHFTDSHQHSVQVDLKEHDVLRKAIKGFEKAVLSAKGVSPARTCWFFTSDYAVGPGGLYLSHSTTLASTSCHLSNTLILWATVLECTFLCHLEMLRNCESLADVTDPIPSNVELEALLRELDEKTSAQQPNGDTSRAVPQGVALEAPSTTDNRKTTSISSLQKLLQKVTSSELSAGEACKHPFTAAHGDADALADVAVEEWHPVLLQRYGVSCGEASLCCAEDAVASVFSNVILNYRAQFPRELWLRLCAQAAMSLSAMIVAAEHRLEQRAQDCGTHAAHAQAVDSGVPEGDSTLSSAETFLHVGEGCSCKEKTGLRCSASMLGGLHAKPAGGFLGGTGHGLPENAPDLVNPTIDEASRESSIVGFTKSANKDRLSGAAKAPSIQQPGALPEVNAKKENGQAPRMSLDVPGAGAPVEQGAKSGSGGSGCFREQPVKECPWAQLPRATVEMLLQMHGIFQEELRQIRDEKSWLAIAQEREVMTNTEMQRRKNVLYGGLAISNSMLQCHAPDKYRALRQSSPVLEAISEKRMAAVYRYLHVSPTQRKAFADRWHTWVGLRHALDHDFGRAVTSLVSAFPSASPSLPPHATAAVASLTAKAAPELQQCCGGSACTSSTAVPAPPGQLMQLQQCGSLHFQVQDRIQWGVEMRDATQHLGACLRPTPSTAQGSINPFMASQTSFDEVSNSTAAAPDLCLMDATVSASSTGMRPSRGGSGRLGARLSFPHRLWRPDAPHESYTAEVSDCAFLTLVSPSMPLSGRTRKRVRSSAGANSQADMPSIVPIGSSGKATAAAEQALEKLITVHHKDRDMHQQHSTLNVIAVAAVASQQEISLNEVRTPWLLRGWRRQTSSAKQSKFKASRFWTETGHLYQDNYIRRAPQYFMPDPDLLSTSSLLIGMLSLVYLLTLLACLRQPSQCIGFGFRVDC